MAMPMKLLHLEDNPHDAELVKGLLTAEGLDCQMNVVANEADFASALERGDFDLILSDFSIPAFNGRSALLMAQAKYPDVPYIFFSGTLGEEAAVQALKDGATDYVL